MKNLIATILLPREITSFERTYLGRINRIALIFFALHVPAFALVAWANDTNPAIAAILTSLVVLGPTAAYFSLDNPRTISVVHGISAMFMGALLVHFGQGAAQIEMHFYFFALLAMCSVFGNPLVIIASTVTVALHHGIVWVTMPRSVFNYDAQWWVVGIHALFVVLEATATCFIARSFFDNVIGLERIVQARTTELDGRNQDMRLLLDNVQQGFLTIDRDGRIAPEHSAAIDRWFGAPVAGATWFDYLRPIAPMFELASLLAWMEVVGDIMPIEVTLDQMPRRLSVRDTHYSVEYRPIGSATPPKQFLVIVTDITEQMAAEHAAEERREAMAIFERVLADRVGLEAFIDDGDAIVSQLVDERTSDLVLAKRLLHTLKGNASLFGLATVSQICHSLEDQIAERECLPTTAEYASLVARWTAVHDEVHRLLGQRSTATEIDELQYAALEAAARSGNAAALLREVQRIKLEPTGKRLRHFAEQTHRLAERLNKPDVVVAVEDHGVRVDPRSWAPFWSVFIHGIRNALDHGIEPAEERGDKPAAGTLTLRTRDESGRIVVEIEDDGRGIDWDAVRQRAERNHVSCRTPEDLQAALFVDGLSTAQCVTDVSGRGIGMGALLEGTRALNGEVEVISRVGQGTVIRMMIPMEAAHDVTSIARAS